LQSLVADNSVDLTAKFEQLAASIAAADAPALNNKKKKKKSLHGNRPPSHHDFND